jgi:tetratricopeptide (TPR) repeat protein
MMPLVAIATLAAVSLARRRADGWRLALALAAFPLATIAVVMIWAFDLSGGAYAIRHAFAAIPPLFCVLAHPELNFASRSRRLALVACSAWGALVAWIGVLNPWSHNTLSAIPPLENVARFCLKRADRLPTEWIGALIRRSSVEPEIGWLDYALELKSAGRLERSESALRESIRLDPRAELPRYHLGVLLGESGRFEESIVVFRELIELNPEHRAGLNGLGVSALNAARLDEAEAAFKRSLQVQPDGNPTADLGLRRIESIRRPTPPPA